MPQIHHRLPEDLVLLPQQPAPPSQLTHPVSHVRVCPGPLPSSISACLNQLLSDTSTIPKSSTTCLNNTPNPPQQATTTTPPQNSHRHALDIATSPFKAPQPQKSVATNPCIRPLPTHTHRLSNHNRQRAAGDHHRDQQPTPKIPRPGNISRNLPTPHTTTPPQCCTSALNTETYPGLISADTPESVSPVAPEAARRTRPPVRHRRTRPNRTVLPCQQAARAYPPPPTRLTPSLAGHPAFASYPTR